MPPTRRPQTFATFHLKELLSLGLKKSHITNIVQKADVFRDITRQQGYAIDYTFDQAVLLHVGGDLSKLGVSFRHINKILLDLADLDYERNRERIVRDRLVMFAFSGVLSEEDDDRLKDIRPRIARRSPKRGLSPHGGSLVRMAPVFLRLLKERDAGRMDDALDDYVRINLHKIVRNIGELVQDPSSHGHRS